MRFNFFHKDEWHLQLLCTYADGTTEWDGWFARGAASSKTVEDAIHQLLWYKRSYNQLSFRVVNPRTNEAIYGDIL